MKANTVPDAIPFSTAVKLCEEIRAEVEREWFTAASRWCWRCQEIAGGEPANRGFLRVAGNRGCILVNARYAELQTADQDVDLL